ncbi:hypothetical protein PaeCFBP13512_23170 [Paenibacillus sp. CFBP13512]|uniref:hypothetical protein n=1 Tax=Paenibacillus sp. CFBP13512 TaxID=2184007 RepID=UPI0010C04FAD|nr:hypothetical protein [Paenibacillus sp. CFBP13512]TKJ83078.1 hypothetical protein PaeCFBP13512_23170 [Paenibacillus sp. CFBP13512]
MEDKELYTEKHFDFFWKNMNGSILDVFECITTNHSNGISRRNLLSALDNPDNPNQIQHSSTKVLEAVNVLKFTGLIQYTEKRNIHIYSLSDEGIRFSEYINTTH